MSETNEDYLALLARERTARMQHEADVYNVLADRSSLTFGPTMMTRVRRSLSRELARLSCALDPSRT